MSQQSSLTQSAHSVRQVLTAYSRATSRPSLHLLKQVPLDRIGDHLRGHLADAQIVEMRLDRQPSEQVLRQRQLDDSLPAPVLHPQRKLRAMVRHRGLVARLLWREAVARPRASQANPEPRAGNL